MARPVFQIEKDMKRTRQDDTKITQSAILKAAEEVISQKGYDGLSVKKVAQSLSMSHANIYRHFSSKGDLIAAVAASWMKDMRDSSEAAISFDGPPEGRLTALILNIRAQLRLRSQNSAAIDIYRFVLKHRPEDALLHQRHRRALFGTILGKSKLEASIIEDALRYFTDPATFLDAEGGDTQIRIENLCRFLMK